MTDPLKGKHDIIEGKFIESDLKDIPIDDAELCELAYFDGMAAGADADQDSDVPVGKQVF